MAAAIIGIYALHVKQANHLNHKSFAVLMSLSQPPARPPLILASSSPYRAQQLQRAGLTFDVHAPAVDESQTALETPFGLAARLARSKCQQVADRHGDKVVIGGDQVAELHGRVLGKAGQPEAALAQLLACQGQQIELHSACAVYDPQTAQVDCQVVSTQLTFRDYPEAMLRQYIALDQPLDCAGSFKIERAGILLFSAVRGSDPSAIEGLPMITLMSQLLAIGYAPFA